MEKDILNSRIKDFKLKMIGNGSYANVFKYKDNFYNCNFALKQLKKTASIKEKERFKHEFDLQSKYNHPNILKAYCYLDDKSGYIMEYCDFSLKEYINKNS